MSVPTRPPTADELRTDPLVQRALEQAWVDSLPDDALRRHEEGGWIYMDLNTAELTIRRAPPGQTAQIEIADPLLLPGFIIVATFHTHPNPAADGWIAGPSASDESVHVQLGVPGLIRADNGVYVTGPPSRRGGLAGGPGFSP